ncbi:MAG: GNAT family N-acetyltransferase [Clostridiaceae bacterium]|nr:GNAT family N-acetyltransferase [Clostridiaceae bacterium]
MEEYVIYMLETDYDAKRITDFLLSEYSFDDRNHTPGEIMQLKNNAIKSLGENNYFYWYAENKKGEIIAAHGVYENEQKTGGYEGDYLVVHKNYRNRGIASKMMDLMLEHLRINKARYLLVGTCDTDAYRAIRHLLEKKGFKQAGHYPHYYFEGEGKLVYYIKI